MVFRDVLQHALVLAPMTKGSNLPYRRLCQEFGARITMSEMTVARRLTQDRRKDLIKQVHKRLEEGKVALRNVRREAQDELRAMEKRKEVSEDEQKRAGERLQKLLDSYVEKVDQIGKAKEAELMEI